MKRSFDLHTFSARVTNDLTFDRCSTFSPDVRCHDYVLAWSYLSMGSRIFRPSMIVTTFPVHAKFVICQIYNPVSRDLEG